MRVGAKDNSQGSVLSFCRVGLRDQAQVAGLDCNRLSLKSHLAGFLLVKSKTMNQILPCSHQSVVAFLPIRIGSQPPL